MKHRCAAPALCLLVGLLMGTPATAETPVATTPSVAPSPVASSVATVVARCDQARATAAILLSEGRHAQALDLLNPAAQAAVDAGVAITPEFLTLWGRTLAACGQWDQAVDRLETARIAGTVDPARDLALGLAYLRVGRDAEAVAMLDPKLQRDPAFAASAHIYRGIALARLGRPSEAHTETVQLATRHADALRGAARSDPAPAAKICPVSCSRGDINTVIRARRKKNHRPRSLAKGK